MDEIKEGFNGGLVIMQIPIQYILIFTIILLVEFPMFNFKTKMNVAGLVLYPAKINFDISNICWEYLLLFNGLGGATKPNPNYS
jgi:hypothetical protein